MAKTKRDPFETIDDVKLDVVSGGAARAAASAARSGTTATSGSDPLLSTLASIESSLAALSSQQNPMAELFQMFEMMYGFGGSPSQSIVGRAAPSTPVMQTTGW